VRRAGWPGALFVLCVVIGAARAGIPRPTPSLVRTNDQLHGIVIDHTHNHGADRRIWSDALGQLRDLYIYLPPGFDPDQRYPLILWLHGFAQDEQSFLRDVILPLDEAMTAGKLPPAIIAAPDGSLNGSPCLITAGSFFLNSRAGRFEDFVMQDVWNFVHEHYPIRPEREAHVLAGVSMGGGAAFNLGIKYRDRVKIVIGIFPPLNSRWVDCHDRYFGNFDPHCWGWRNDFSRSHEVVGRFYGVVTIRLRRVVEPIYGRGPDVLEQVSLENPIEMMDRLDLKDGELDMYVAHGGRDQFNIDAQVESFLWHAQERGLHVGVGYDPHGKHDLPTAKKLLPGILNWLNPLLSDQRSAISGQPSKHLENGASAREVGLADR
jgi:S-formylglutathione hydrolase FrmB